MDQPLSIAMTSYYLPSGSKIGVGYQVHELANQLVRRGHRVTVFSGCGPPAGSLYETRTVALTGRNRTFRFAWRMREQDWMSFDVLHAHGDDYWLRNIPRPAHIRTLHGSCFDEALHIHGARERLRMVLLGFSEVASTLVADQSVMVSSSARRWLPWVRTIIPNGVDLSRFAPGERSPAPSILFVGTYERRKRGRLLADAFEQTVLPAVPDAELWMVCEDAQPRPGVKIFGRVSDAELGRLYGSAWVFCLPSTYEGFGIPYIEAMASGSAVVATRNAGAVEITRRGTLGEVVDDRTLGSTLVKLLLSQPRRERLTTAALAEIKRFDIDVVADRYEVLYRREIAAVSRGSAGPAAARSDASESTP